MIKQLEKYFVLTFPKQINYGLVESSILPDVLHIPFTILTRFKKSDYDSSNKKVKVKFDNIDFEFIYANDKYIARFLWNATHITENVVWNKWKYRKDKYFRLDNEEIQLDNPEIIKKLMIIDSLF